MKRQQSQQQAELLISACTAQHVGDRQEQQDRVAVFSASRGPRCALGVLADGMGGKSGGAIAAENVMLTSRRRFQEFQPEIETPAEFFDSLIFEIHTVLKLTGIAAGIEPHSTFAAVLMQPERVDWCHIGDSRIYHIRNRKLLHCTSDHTYAQELISRGTLTPELAMKHPAAAQLVNALGALRTPTPTLGHLSDPQPGDTFLICSDGLWNYFHAGEIVLVLEQEPPRQAAETLLKRARERADGHGDNCSLAVLRFNDSSVPAPTRKTRAAAAARG